EADMTQSLTGGLDCMEEVLELLREAIADEPPATLQEGGVIRSGWSAQLDDVRAVRDGARDFIASLQARERERTGISTLKVGFNRVFGYYLEVTKTNLAKVPDDYVRKQTLTNGERYFTPELKEWEEKVFGAEDRIGQLETELFSDVRARVSGAVFRLQDLAARVAALDVLACFAEVAIRRGYVRPEVHTAST
ncbi:MAG: DNA mismatch repair protein MutS, partial [Gemmatimonadetes bacterium]|nr:DNA mismatch repair protein MutS [Gemmatimonadota bacterium]